MTDSAPEAVIEAMARHTCTRNGEHGCTLCNRPLHPVCRQRALNALSAASRAGFVLVPVEATEKMILAWAHQGAFAGTSAARAHARDVWNAMIAARPGAAPTKQEE